MRCIVLSIVAGWIVAPAVLAVSPTLSDSNWSLQAIPCDPDLVLGNQSCVKCHASEIKAWEKTPHARTFDELHRRPEAKQIATKLGLNSIKHAGRCTACHYTPQTDSSTGPDSLTGNVHIIAGVSCESCHGAAKPWMDLHHDYGGEDITRVSESATHRRQRIDRSVAMGMRNPANVYLVAQSCLRCHTTGDEELVNVGGHSAGSLDFEFVSWSQGTIRHNFVRTDGVTNEVSSRPRMRLMFVAGMIAELEASLRATAMATEKATFGVTAAKRAARAGARLKSAASKVNQPILDQVVAVFASVTLKLRNAQQLNQAADEVARLGFEFAAEGSGDGLESLDRFIPPPETWK